MQDSAVAAGQPDHACMNTVCKGTCVLAWKVSKTPARCMLTHTRSAYRCRQARLPAVLRATAEVSAQGRSDSS